MATRWGICGAGKIAFDFCICLKSLPSSEHKIVAVAARDKERAEKFAADFDIPKSYNSYADLATDPNIDIVYIATIHTNHVENSLMYINAGKNVLCEKPMALSLEGCKKVLAAAREKGVLFVEGYWSRFFPAYKFIQEYIKSGALGEVIIAQASFTSNASEVQRLTDPKIGGGILMDMGVYTVMLANFVFKGKPDSIHIEGNKFDTGADKTGIITLRYPGNKFASLVYSGEVGFGCNSLTIRGSKGCITVPDFFWCPNRVVLQNNEVKYFQLPDVKNSENFNFSNCEGFVYEAEEVRECLKKGLKESPIIPHEDSETIMYILQELQNQMGIKYDFE